MIISLKQLRDISNYFVYQSYSSDVITDDVEVEISIIEENLNNNILQSVFLLQTNGTNPYYENTTILRSLEVYPSQDKRPSMILETQKRNLK